MEYERMSEPASATAQDTNPLERLRRLFPLSAPPCLPLQCAPFSRLISFSCVISRPRLFNPLQNKNPTHQTGVIRQRHSVTVEAHVGRHSGRKVARGHGEQSQTAW